MEILSAYTLILWLSDYTYHRPVSSVHKFVKELGALSGYLLIFLTSLWLGTLWLGTQKQTTLWTPYLEMWGLRMPLVKAEV